MANECGYDLVEVFRRLEQSKPPKHLAKRARRIIKRLEDDAIRAPEIVADDQWVALFFRHASGFCNVHISADGYWAVDGKWLSISKPVSVFTDFRPIRSAVRRFSTRVINYERRQLWKRWEETGEKRPRMMQHAGTATRKSRRPSGGCLPEVVQGIVRWSSPAPTASNPSGESTGDTPVRVSGGN